MDILKICGIGFVATVFGIYFKSTKGEYSLYISIVAGIVVFACLVGKLEGIIEAIQRIKGYTTTANGYIGVLIKVVGITYIADFSANICKDAGYGALGNQIEIFAKITIMSLSIPIIETLIDCISGILV